MWGNIIEVSFMRLKYAFGDAVDVEWLGNNYTGDEVNNTR